MAKCSICGKKAVIKIRYARINLCEEHFIQYYERRVRNTVERFKLISRGHKVVVALSGGKDSVSMFSALKSFSDDLGFQVIPIHLNLGIGEFSEESEAIVKKAATMSDTQTLVINVRDAIGAGIPELALASKRPPCSVCGLVKRYFINLAAVKIGAASIALGHHLDDLAAYALKAILTGDYGSLRKLGPKTESEEGVAVGRIRPLYLTTERENLVYALVKGLPFMRGRCPNAMRRSFESEIKAFMNKLDVKHPGVRVGFMKSVVRELIPKIPPPTGSIIPCKHCGMPSRDGVCGFCKLTEKALGEPAGPKAAEYVDRLAHSG